MAFSENTLKKVLFIVNPRSGGRFPAKISQLIEQHVPKQFFDYRIEFTRDKGHATELARQAVNNRTDYVFAIGGDGTMNEVARSLVRTESTLGIVPTGSGNGLARHLTIPLSVINALRLLTEGKRICIDSGTLNDEPFFCIAGAGFDAYIGKCFDEQKTRGFQTYFKTTLREFTSYKPELYRLTVGERRVEKKAFLVSFANSSQYGNNAYIAPKASLQDGLLDVCLLRPFPPLEALNMGVKLFNRTLHNSRYLDYWTATEAVLERKTSAPVHLDGEPRLMNEVLTVKIKPASLWVLVP